MTASHCDKLIRLLGKIVPSHFYLVLPQPLQIGGEPDKDRIDIDPANPGRTAHGRIIDFEYRHGSAPLEVIDIATYVQLQLFLSINGSSTLVKLSEAMLPPIIGARI